MRTLLESGKRAIRRMKLKPPSEGTFHPLFCKEFPGGWYYQVDYVFDKRCNNEPYVAVWGFKPPRVFWAKSADYYLFQDYKRRGK